MGPVSTCWPVATVFSGIFLAGVTVLDNFLLLVRDIQTTSAPRSVISLPSQNLTSQ